MTLKKKNGSFDFVFFVLAKLVALFFTVSVSVYFMLAPYVDIAGQEILEFPVVKTLIATIFTTFILMLYLCDRLWKMLVTLIFTVGTPYALSRVARWVLVELLGFLPRSEYSEALRDLANQRLGYLYQETFIKTKLFIALTALHILIMGIYFFISRRSKTPLPISVLKEKSPGLTCVVILLTLVLPMIFSYFTQWGSNATAVCTLLLPTVAGGLSFSGNRTKRTPTLKEKQKREAYASLFIS